MSLYPPVARQIKHAIALLHELNEVTKQQVDRLKPEEHHP